MSEMIIEVWMQQPAARFLSEAFFASLKKWTQQDFSAAVPLDATIQAMEDAAIAIGMMQA